MNVFDGRARLRDAPKFFAAEHDDFFSTGGRELAAIACERARQAVDNLEEEWVRSNFNLTLSVQDRVRVLDEAARKAEIQILTVVRFRDILLRELREAWTLYKPTQCNESEMAATSSTLPTNSTAILDLYRNSVAVGDWSTCNAIEAGVAERTREDAPLSVEIAKLKHARLKSEAPGAAEAIASASENLGVVDAVVSAAFGFIAEVRRRIETGGTYILLACTLGDVRGHRESGDTIHDRQEHDPYL